MPVSLFQEYYLHLVILCIELIQCPDLTVANGQITIGPAGRPFGSRTTYECNHGFALVGDGDHICQEDSSWSGTNPVCSKRSILIWHQNFEVTVTCTKLAARFDGF